MLEKHLNELNPKEFEIGQVVYYVSQKYGDYGSEVRWGIVSDIYSDGYALENYEPIDIRTVEGTPINLYKFNQPRRKLPKGWSWDTDLVHLGENKLLINKAKKYKYNLEPETLKTFIQEGLLVKPSSQKTRYCPYADIDKDGYTIVLRERTWAEHKSDYVILPYPKLYSTWQEAQEIIDAEKAEFKRQSELSDYDWSVEQIDKTLEKHQAFYHISDEIKQKMRDFILSQKNVEDIVTRSISEGFQWKYDRNKKWMTVII